MDIHRRRLPSRTQIHGGRSTAWLRAQRPLVDTTHAGQHPSMRPQPRRHPNDQLPELFNTAQIIPGGERRGMRLQRDSKRRRTHGVHERRRDLRVDNEAVQVRRWRAVGDGGAGHVQHGSGQEAGGVELAAGRGDPAGMAHGEDLHCECRGLRGAVAGEEAGGAGWVVSDGHVHDHAGEEERVEGHYDFFGEEQGLCHLHAESGSARRLHLGLERAFGDSSIRAGCGC
jgi:hypothetical protein